MAQGTMGGLLVKPLPDVENQPSGRYAQKDAIYRRGKISQPFIIIPGGANGLDRINATLGGWQAQTVQVDNYSKQYIAIGDANVYVAPGQIGVYIAVRDVGNAHAIPGVPPGIVQPAAGAGSCILKYYEDALTPQSGIIVATS